MREQFRLTVAAMATTGREPIWSMGDDTPPAFLARRGRGVAGYLRQSFAQVTNPAIDPERERLVMSLAVSLGPRPPLLDLASCASRPAIRLDPPILRSSDLEEILAGGGVEWRIVRLDATWPLRAAIRRACATPWTAWSGMGCAPPGQAPT